MSAFQLLELAETRGLLDPSTASKLREQLASLQRSVSVDELAAMLVKRGRLTDFQARSLVESLREMNHARAEGVDLTADTAEASSLELLSDSSEDLPPLEAIPIAEPIVEMSDSDASPELPVAELIDDETLEAEHSITRSNEQMSLRSFVQSMITRKSGWKRGRGGPNFLMLGGGALVLLLVVGGLLSAFLTRENAEAFIAVADESYKDSNYRQAATDYSEFIAKFPKHEDASRARVRHVFAKIRNDLKASDLEAAFQTFSVEIDTVASESAFDHPDGTFDAKGELAGILHETYEGFAERADQSKIAEEKTQLLDRALLTREHIDNPSYLGSSRAAIELSVSAVEKLTDKVRRDLDRERELQNALVQIKDATKKNDTVTAYSIHKSLLGQYPGLRANTDLKEQIASVAAAEKNVVVVTDGVMAAVANDHRLRVPNRVLLARRRTKSKASATGQVFATAHGALYGLDAATGKVLWRRWRGFESTTHPITLGGAATDVVALDEVRHELIRLDGPTGKLVWRLELGEHCAQPVFAGRIFLSLEGGRLLSVDPQSGRVVRSATLPQSLYSPAVVGRDGVLFQAGAHSSLYAFDSDSLNCLGVYSIGHKSGAVTSAPFVVEQVVVVPERISPDTTLLRSLALDSNGQIAADRPANELQIDGYVVSAVRLANESVLITTDLGAAYILTSNSNDPDKKLRKIATKPRSVESSTAHFGSAVGNHVVIAGRGLGRFEIQNANGSFVSRWELVEPSFHTAPPDLRGETMFVQYKRPATQAVRVAALEWDGDSWQPSPKWSVDLGAAPAGPAYFDKQGRGIIAVSKDAAAWKIGSAAMKDGALDRAIADLPGRTTFGNAQLMGDGVFFSAGGGRTGYMIYDPAARGTKLQRNDVQLGDKELACPLTIVANHLIACSTSGAVYLVDAKTGKRVSQPYRHETRVDAHVEWLTPAALKDDSVAVAQTNGFMAVLKSRAGRLAATIARAHDTSFESPIVALHDNLFLIGKNGPTTVLMCIKANDLEVAEATDLESGYSSGPHVVGDKIMCLTKAKRVHAFSSDGKPLWSAELPTSPLVGPPVIDKGSWVFASVQGKLWRVDPESGETIGWSAGSDSRMFDVGEPLGAAPCVLGNRLLLLGRDCTLFVLSSK